MNNLKRGDKAYWLRGGKIVPVTITRKVFGRRRLHIGIRLKDGEKLDVNPRILARTVDELLAIARESKRQAIENAELHLRQAEAEVERRRAEVERLRNLPDPKVEE
jgi:predicted DNA-binding antitoxin AbrB/MazE fold protein